MVSAHTDGSEPAVPGSLDDFLRVAKDEDFVGDITQRIDAELMREVPDLTRDEKTQADLEGSTAAIATAFLHGLKTDPGGVIQVPPETLEFARNLALRRHDVTLLLRAFRIGQRLAWSELTAILATEVPDPELRLTAITEVLDKLSRDVEALVDASVAVFTEERDRWLSGALARRADLVQSLLRGDPVDPDEATGALSHRLHRHQLALLLWDTGPEHDAPARLEAAAKAAATLLGSPPPLTLPDGTRSLQVWLTVPPDQDLSKLDRLPPAASTMRVASGRPEYGVAGFRATHRQASRAARVALASTNPRRLTRYDDVALVAAFLDDPPAMRELIAQELGGPAGLGAPGEAARRLRETALALLRAGGSAREAAAAIGVHKNTVLYRIPRIEELLGHPLSERRLPLEMALELVEQLGDGVLPAG